MVEEVVASMQSSIDPTLILESDDSTKVVVSMQSSIDPTLLLGSDDFDHVFIISISVPYKLGGNALSSSMLPPSLRVVSFDWNDLVEYHLHYSPPF
jgi:hypothetical protein